MGDNRPQHISIDRHEPTWGVAYYLGALHNHPTGGGGNSFSRCAFTTWLRTPNHNYVILVFDIRAAHVACRSHTPDLIQTTHTRGGFAWLALSRRLGNRCELYCGKDHNHI